MAVDVDEPATAGGQRTPSARRRLLVLAWWIIAAAGVLVAIVGFATTTLWALRTAAAVADDGRPRPVPARRRSGVAGAS